MTKFYFQQNATRDKKGYAWRASAADILSARLSVFTQLLMESGFIPDARKLQSDVFEGGAFIAANNRYGAVFSFVPGGRDSAHRDGTRVLNVLFFNGAGISSGSSLKKVFEHPALKAGANDSVPEEIEIFLGSDFGTTNQEKLVYSSASRPITEDTIIHFSGNGMVRNFSGQSAKSAAASPSADHTAPTIGSSSPLASLWKRGGTSQAPAETPQYSAAASGAAGSRPRSTLPLLVISLIIGISLGGTAGWKLKPLIQPPSPESLVVKADRECIFLELKKGTIKVCKYCIKDEDFSKLKPVVETRWSEDIQVLLRKSDGKWSYIYGKNLLEESAEPSSAEEEPKPPTEKQAESPKEEK